jgi:glutathione synthase/RimK-type ligase-like ATP-grasp enzyme
MPLSICILIPAPDYWEDWSLPKMHYERLLGPDLSFRSWTDTGDLSGFSLILPLLAWGYQRNVPSWYALLDRLEREALPVANPARVLRWNSDKAYLAEMAAAGVPTVPTMMREAMNDAALDSARSLFGTNRLVIKPPVSGGADGTFLIGASDPLPTEAVGRRMLIQPYLPAIAAEGEMSLFFFGGRYSHAISKHPANGDFRVQEQFGGSERRIDPPAEALALAETVFAATEELMHHAPLTYARVDMLRDEDGNFRLMELEAIEPSLFLHFAGDQGAQLADAVRARSENPFHLAR